jgi:hypothetical protein
MPAPLWSWELLESGQHLSHGHLALRPYPNQRMRVIYYRGS